MCFTVRRLYATFAHSTKVLNFENTKGVFLSCYNVDSNNKVLNCEKDQDKVNDSLHELNTIDGSKRNHYYVCEDDKHLCDGFIQGEPVFVVAGVLTTQNKVEGITRTLGYAHMHAHAHTHTHTHMHTTY